MNYLKTGVKSSDRAAEQAEMARPLTPKSERSRASYGSLEMSLQNLQGRCEQDRKCVRSEGHIGAHWPDSSKG